MAGQVVYLGPRRDRPKTEQRRVDRVFGALYAAGLIDRVELPEDLSSREAGEMLEELSQAIGAMQLFAARLQRIRDRYEG